MENVINDRLKNFMKAQRLTQREFCAMINVSLNTLKTTFQRDSDIGVEMLSKITNSFQSLNVDWLLTGEGEMLRQECPAPTKQVRTAFPQNGFKMIENEEAFESIPEEFRKWMKPFYPDIKIGAGMEMGACHGRSKYFILVPNSERVEFWATVEGHSMYPKYGQNDLVGLAYAHLDAVFGGHNYVVELKTGSAHLKRVDFIKGKNDVINLHSYNPDFDDKEMELDKIQNFFKVCMHIGFE